MAAVLHNSSPALGIPLPHQHMMDYTPRYFFVSDSTQDGMSKNQHVMKEFLRKRDSIRRQQNSVPKPQKSPLPWLRRENVEHGLGLDKNPHLKTTQPSVSADGDCSTSLNSRQPTWPPERPAGQSHRNPTEVPSKAPSSLFKCLDTCRKDYGHLKQSINTTVQRPSRCDSLSDTYLPPRQTLKRLLQYSLSATFLYAILSLGQDFEDGHHEPTPGTLKLILEAIQELKEQLEEPNGICESSILAVICLWWYEVVLRSNRTECGSKAFGKQSDLRLLEDDVQGHVDGLQKLVESFGGLENLSSEAQWLLAWCMCTLPGNFRLDTISTVASNRVTLSSSPQKITNPCPTDRLFDLLRKIPTQGTCSQPSHTLLHAKEFLPLRDVLLRLQYSQCSTNQQKSVMLEYRQLISMVSVLLLVLEVLTIADAHVHRHRQNCWTRLTNIQRKLVSAGTEIEGSTERAWQILITEQEAPQLRLDSNIWSINEMVNVVKGLKMITLYALIQSLMSFLLPESSDGGLNTLQLENVVLQIHCELQSRTPSGSPPRSPQRTVSPA